MIDWIGWTRLAGVIAVSGAIALPIHTLIAYRPNVALELIGAGLCATLAVIAFAVIQIDGRLRNIENRQR